MRIYGPAQTPYARVLLAAMVSQKTKRQLRQLHQQLNPFQLARDIECAKKEIESRRLLEPLN